MLVFTVSCANSRISYPLPSYFGHPNGMRVLTLVGNRPQFVKAAAVSARLRERHDEVLVHSGQHYDDELSAVFFRELGLPAPDRELGIGSGTAGEQVAGMMHALEPVLDEVRPDLVLVYGDTNTTLAGALSCARLGLPLAHVESGMRSFDDVDARGAQPRAHRPPQRPAAVLHADRRREPRARGRRRGRRAGRRRDGGRDAADRADRRPRVRRPRAVRGGRGRVPAGDGAPRGQRRRSRRSSTGSWRCCSRCRCRRSSRCIRARARGSRQPGSSRSSSGGGPDAAASTRVPGLPPAAAPRARGADRLRRRAEGGLPARGPVHDAARDDRVDRDGRARLEPARGPEPRAGPARRSPISPARPGIPTCTAGDTPGRRS